MEWQFFAAAYFAHRRMKYLGNLRAEITVIGQGDMEHRVTVKGHDEISALAVELDNMRLTLKTVWKMSGKFTGTIRS